MPRYYEPRYQDLNQDQFHERTAKKKKTPWTRWLLYGLGLIVVIIIILFILSATGKLQGRNTTDLNETPTIQPTQLEQITTYILAQKKEGTGKEDIVKRLQLAGYPQDEIELAFKMSDPIVQYILTEEKTGKTKPIIVEELLSQGVTVEEIQNRYEVIEESRALKKGEFLRKNWVWILIAAVVIILIVRSVKEARDEKKLMPKVYTLDECLLHAKEYLDEKDKAYNPSKQYRNRPDIRQYRFIFEEPLYPEFNDHQPTGHKVGKRLYFLIAIGYDNEIIDYQETHDDNQLTPFLYGAPKGFEQSGAKEYLGLRRTSEEEIEEPERGSPFESDELDSRYPNIYSPRRRRTQPRIRPGPVTGFERP